MVDYLENVRRLELWPKVIRMLQHAQTDLEYCCGCGAKRGEDGRHDCVASCLLAEVLR